MLAKQDGGGDPDNIAWTNNPVATADANGVEINMCPGTGGLLHQAGTGTDNHVAVTDDQAYVGGWTMERFVQVQEAIWKKPKSKADKPLSIRFLIELAALLRLYLLKLPVLLFH
jgi:hypothetical protein